MHTLDVRLRVPLLVVELAQFLRLLMVHRCQVSYPFLHLLEGFSRLLALVSELFLQRKQPILGVASGVVVRIVAGF